MNPTFSLALPVPISQDAHRFAEQFAREQATPQKGKQVYLNTLAVVAVRDYLQWLSMATAIDRGDCWHPAKRAMFNVADLVLSHLGKLECIPILPDQNALEISPEVTEDRLGYVAVQFGEELQQVELLGFLPAHQISFPPSPVPLDRLDPLDNLIDIIDWHRQWKNLWQRLSQPEWEPLELLLNPSTRSLKTATRSPRYFRKREPVKFSFSRGKAIEWQADNVGSSLLLTISVGDASTEEVEVNMKLYPREENAYLPAGLQVSLLDESGAVCMNAQAREKDGWIELEFECKPQEEFALKIILNENQIVENFKV